MSNTNTTPITLKELVAEIITLGHEVVFLEEVLPSNTLIVQSNQSSSVSYTPQPNYGIQNSGSFPAPQVTKLQQKLNEIGVITVIKTWSSKETSELSLKFPRKNDKRVNFIEQLLTDIGFDFKMELSQGKQVYRFKIPKKNYTILTYWIR